MVGKYAAKKIMSAFGERWERIRDLDCQLIFHQQNLEKYRDSRDSEKLRATAVEILILRKQIREMARR
jgi:hypothetical protein